MSSRESKAHQKPEIWFDGHKSPSTIDKAHFNYTQKGKIIRAVTKGQNHPLNVDALKKTLNEG